MEIKRYETLINDKDILLNKQANILIDSIRELSTCKIFNRTKKINYGKPSLMKLKCHLVELDYNESIAQEIEDLFTTINSIRNSYPFREKL